MAMKGFDPKWLTGKHSGRGMSSAPSGAEVLTKWRSDKSIYARVPHDLV